MILATSPIVLSCAGRMFEASWQAAIMVVLIMLIQRALRGRISANWRAAMWMLVFIRLALPVLPESRFSLYGLSRPAVPAERFFDSQSQTIIRFGEPTPPSAAPPTLPPPQATAPPVWTVRWTDIAIAVWLAGTACLLVRGTLASILLTRRIAVAPTLRDDWVVRILDESCRAVRVNRRPRVVETGAVQSPALCGWLRPTILLPMGLTARVLDDAMRFILLHELAHLKRRDILIGWCVWALCAVHWFNPLAWLAARRFREETEIACDARAISADGRARWREYGNTLIDLIRLSPHPVAPPGVAAVLSDRTTLRRRVLALSNPVRPSLPRSLAAAVSILAIGCASLTSPKRSDRTFADPLETRSYDVRDLLIATADFPRPPIGEDMPEDDAAHVTRADMEQALIEMLTSTVDTPSWASQGGRGTARFDGGELVITQSSANHDRIGSALATLRDRRSVQVVVEARFISGADVSKLAEQLGGDGDGQWIDVGDKAQLFSPIPAGSEVAARLNKLAQEAPLEWTTLTAPRVTVFNGQRAWVAVTSDVAYVRSYEAEPGDKQFGPVVDTVVSGLVLDCTPMVSQDRKYVTITLRPRLTTLLDMKEQPWPDAPPGRNDLRIQVPTIRTTGDVNTTVSMPDDHVAFLRIAPVLDPPQPDAPPEEPLLAMIRATVLIPKPATQP